MRHIRHEHDIIVLLFWELFNLPLRCDVTHHEKSQVPEVFMHPFVVIVLFLEQLVTLDDNNLFIINNFEVPFEVKLKIK